MIFLLLFWSTIPTEGTGEKTRSIFDQSLKMFNQKKLFFLAATQRRGLWAHGLMAEGLLIRCRTLIVQQTCAGASMQSKNKCDTFVYDKEDKFCWLTEGAEMRNGSQLGGWCPGKGESPDQSQ